MPENYTMLYVLYVAALLLAPAPLPFPSPSLVPSGPLNIIRFSGFRSRCTSLNIQLTAAEKPVTQHLVPSPLAWRPATTKMMAWDLLRVVLKRRCELARNAALLMFLTAPRLAKSRSHAKRQRSKKVLWPISPVQLLLELLEHAVYFAIGSENQQGRQAAGDRRGAFSFHVVQGR